MATYVLPMTTQCATVITTYDLWMLKSSYDTFALVINFINSNWVTCHIIVGLFETLDTFGVVLTKQVKILLVEFNLTNEIIMYVKDEGINLNYHTTAFIFVVSCELL
jgi:hypothetical protein